MKNKFILVLMLIIFPFSIYSQNMDESKKADQIMKTDLAFSKMSVAEGRNKAFIHYAHNEAVILEQNNTPIVGKSALKSHILQNSDTNYVLSWKPEYGFVSESDDLGYTYGIWKYETKDSIGNKRMQEGTYVSIWKKDENGDWKYVLDSGNDGLSKDNLKK